MKQKTKDRLSFALLIFAVAVFSFEYGLIAGIWDYPPAPGVRKLYKSLADMTSHWKNDLGFRPTRTLVRGYGSDRPKCALLAPTAVQAGHILISGLTPNHGTLQTVVLIDRKGEEIHSWPVDYDLLDPDGPGSRHVFFHGLAVFEDGSLIVNFDDGRVLARIGPCGEMLWRTMGLFHHAVSRSHDGTIWTLRDSGGSHDTRIVQVNPDNGKILKSISLMDDIMKPQGLQGIMATHTRESENEPEFLFDPFHLNQVEALDPETAKSFPMFEAGDLLISLRNLNLLIVVDSDTAELKWWQIGPWFRQHDPHFLKDGTIMVYDNNMGFGHSRILSVGPATGELKVLFEGSEKTPFYSWRRGKVQILPNKNLLITESEKGRAFEVTAEEELVWEYNNVYDEASNGVVSNAIYLPPDFFNEGVLECGLSNQK